MPAVCRHRGFDLGRRAGHYRGDLRASLEQLGRLAVDDVEVALLGRVRVVRVHQLQHLALGDGVGRIRHDLLYAQVAEVDHHLEGARIQVVADQHARLVAEHVICGFPAPPQVRAVDDIVVEQCGGVDELDDGCGDLVLVALVAAGPRGQHHAQGPQALAAGPDDVLRPPGLPVLRRWPGARR